MTYRLILPAVATLLLAACASQPKPLQGAFVEITPHAAMETDQTGAMVRWGGRIVQVEPRANATCFEMISTRLTATVSNVSAAEIYRRGAGLLVLPAGLPLCMIPPDTR